jgi:hypothetical protein
MPYSCGLCEGVFEDLDGLIAVRIDGRRAGLYLSADRRLAHELQEISESQFNQLQLEQDLKQQQKQEQKQRQNQPELSFDDLFEDAPAIAPGQSRRLRGPSKFQIYHHGVHREH